jgi:ATP-dependent DNA helicase RecG
MRRFEEILDKMSIPLHFAARANYHALPMIRDLSDTMTTFLEQWHNASLSQDVPEQLRRDMQDFATRLSHLFYSFENLSVKEKKKNITLGLKLIGEYRQKISPAATQKDDPIHLLNVYLERLSTPVQFVKGVGPRLSAIFGKKGIRTVEELLYFVPRKYEDRREIKRIDRLQTGGKSTVIGEITHAAMSQYGRKKIFEVSVSDGHGTIKAKWFHGAPAYLKKVLRVGSKVILTGEVSTFLYEKNMLHPDFEITDTDDNSTLSFKRIVPVYSETEGLYQKTIRKIVMRAIQDFCAYLASPIPETICRRHHLISMEEAVRRVHFPDPDDNIDSCNEYTSPAHRQLIFDELFFLQLGLAMKKKGRALEHAEPFHRGIKSSRFLNMLPFSLTKAQLRVIEEIYSDLGKSSAMNRLLQGDVGSGKTVVSMAAMFLACENGFQAAMMVPTEILAEQHYANLKQWADPLGVQVALMTGSLSNAKKNMMTIDIASGKTGIVVGTHALIQDEIHFQRLGLVVIDEQHRFGVIQRATLRGKGKTPHTLIMTATPIPRTLAMTVYGDLDVSVIDEMPPEKKPVQTKVFYEKQRHTVYDIIRRELHKGRQAFIVYPLVTESEALDLKDATRMAEHLSKDVFPDYQVGLVHGRMKSADKDGVMEKFRTGEIDILVATTIIEVGIDMPQASLMIVEHAERFGLSQLHQLRGRVGRRDIPSACILLVQSRSTEDAHRRLRVMEETNDGFRIAEADMSIRGPGEMLGIRQSGMPDFRIANIVRDARLLIAAQKEAFDLVEGDPDLLKPAHELLRMVLMHRWAGRLDLAKVG